MDHAFRSRALGESRRLLLITAVILLALGAVVVLLRLYGLTDYPPRLASDEAMHGLDALQVLQGKHAVFFPANHGREGLIVYAIALSISALGRTELAIRLPTALASTGAVFVVFWLGLALFRRDEESATGTLPGHGLFVGGVGAGLLAVSLSQTIIGRTAMRGNFLPLLIPLCLVLLWEGYRQRSWLQIALAGVCAGLLPYTYIAARFTLLLFLFFGLSFLVSSGSVTRMRVRVDLLKRNLPMIGIFLGVSGLVAAPILIHFALHPDSFFDRSSQVSILNSPLRQGNPLRALLANVWEHLLLFGFRGDPGWVRNFPGRPMLNIWEAFFFWLGAGIAFKRWRRPAYRLLLIWLVALALPSVLSLDLAGVRTLRFIGAMPAVYLLAGVGMWETLRFLQERSRAMQWGIGRILRENETRVVLTVVIIVAGLILVKSVTTFRIYFQGWAQHREVNDSYEKWLGDWARTSNALPSDAKTVYLIPGFSYTPQISIHHTFEYLYLGPASAHTVYQSAPDSEQQIESILKAKEKISTVKIVEWNTQSRWVREDVTLVTFLLSKYGRYLGSDEYADFQIHKYADISFERPWTFYEEIEPPTVLYDGGITLHGLALGQGAVQLTSRQPLNLEQDRSLWGVMRWQTAPELNVDYAISLRLYDTQGQLVHQADDLIWHPSGHVPSSHWSSSELVDSLFQLEFPDSLLPGEYELRLVVYNFDTLVPTVEIGVWQPEKILARLRLG